MRRFRVGRIVGPRGRRAAGLLGGVLAGIVILLAGIWLGGHPTNLPSPLRGSLFEARRSAIATDQAVSILTSRYYRPLERSMLVDQGLSCMVASLEDPYSHYLDPVAYRQRNEQSTQEPGGIGIRTMAEPAELIERANVTPPVASWQMITDHHLRTPGR